MRETLTLKDHHREGRLFAARLLWCLAVVVTLTLGLAARMIWLQYIEHERFTTLSERNRIQTLAVAPPRGLILDRRGRVLADNQPDFAVSIIPEATRDLATTITEIAALITVDEEDLDRFHRRLKAPRRPWEPVPLRTRLSEQELAIVAASQHLLPAARLEAYPVRHYPHGELLSHVLGYVNRISADDLAQMTAQQQANYSATHFHGRAGIERVQETRLHGQVGYRKVETNAHGRILQVLEEAPPTAGEDIRLHLDLDVQRAAWDALAGRRGVVIAIDPRNAGVLAFVSKPGFDPNLFVTGISHKEFARYRDNPHNPLINRGLQGRYPPGSTVKPMIGLAALEQGVTDWERSIDDPGYFQLEGVERPFRDWKRQGHGRVDLHKAIVESCDTYFYDLGFRLGIDNLSRYMAGFGLGSPTGIDLQGEGAGILPSRTWKRSARGEAWFQGDTINISIGQGYMLMTPLQLVQATAILARRGTSITPRIIQAPPAPATLAVRASEQNWTQMDSAMQDVLHSLRGTAHSSGRNSPYRISGKTGTAQVYSLATDEEYDAETLDEQLRDHALFIAYAPSEAPAIAVVAIVENAGSGGSVAAPVARQVMDAWLLDAKGSVQIPAATIHTPDQQITEPSQ